jgi:cytochrome P450
MRRLLSPAFSRRIVEALRPRFADLAGELADSFAGAGRCEFMADFAEPYAARVIAILLGIAEQEWRTIAAESATVGLAMGVRIREHLPRIEAALAALYDYADAVIAARERDPRDDLVTSLVKSQADDGGLTGAGLTGAELRDALVLLIFGGFDTTRNQLGLAMQVFLEHTGQWRLLGERPELGAAAVEESCGSGPPRPGSPGKPWPTSPSTVSTSRPEPRSTCSANRQAPTPCRRAAANSTSPRPGGRPTSGSAAESTTASGTT